MYRVLIIDDEQDLLAILNKLFEKHGFDVATLSRAGTTFKTVEVFKPDIILLDIKLCEYDGRDICFELKSSNKTKNVKIILCSGFRSNEVSYTDYGADDYISKPFDFKVLLKKINHHLNINS